MGHSPEQRDSHSMCGARKKDGTSCRAFAGQGTNHPGYGTCKFHGGSTSNQVKHATKLEAQATMVKMGGPISITAFEALETLVQLTGGHVAWLHEEVRRAEDLSTPEMKVILELYGVERDRLARVSEASAKAGTDERRLEVTIESAQMWVGVFNAVFDVLELSDEQRTIAGKEMRRQLVERVGTDDGSPESTVEGEVVRS